jgi:hypothetical protein
MWVEKVEIAKPRLQADHDDHEGSDDVLVGATLFCWYVCRVILPYTPTLHFKPIKHDIKMRG